VRCRCIAFPQVRITFRGEGHDAYDTLQDGEGRPAMRRMRFEGGVTCTGSQWRRQAIKERVIDYQSRLRGVQATGVLVSGPARALYTAHGTRHV
jgi:hypothetical protein